METPLLLEVLGTGACAGVQAENKTLVHQIRATSNQSVGFHGDPRMKVPLSVDRELLVAIGTYDDSTTMSIQVTYLKELGRQRRL